jgi:hypothetical protein
MWSYTEFAFGMHRADSSNVNIAYDVDTATLEGECAMSDTMDSSISQFEMLKRLGAKWAVLTAMTADMIRKHVELPGQVVEELKTARLKIGSGCFSPCEVTCGLSKAEGQIFSRCHLIDPQEFEDWCNLLAEAMQGKLDYERIRGISVLAPVRSDCEFLRCACSESP